MPTPDWYAERNFVCPFGGMLAPRPNLERPCIGVECGGAPYTPLKFTLFALGVYRLGYKQLTGDCLCLTT